MPTSTISALAQSVQYPLQYKYLFTKLQLYSNLDLVLLQPKEYLDLTSTININKAISGKLAVIVGKVVSYLRSKKYLSVVIQDATAQAELIFFHVFPSYSKQFAVGNIVRVYGIVKAQQSDKCITIIHPKLTPTIPNKFLTAIYTNISPFFNTLLTKIIADILAAHIIADTLPQALYERYNLPSLVTAITLLHQVTPTTLAQQATAYNRLKIDELVAQQVLQLQQIQSLTLQPAPALYCSQAQFTHLLSYIGFTLTMSQYQALAEIRTELASNVAMNRLLQGDVGSGKTIVAMLSCLIAVQAGYQAAIMVPTEILAQQHFACFNKQFSTLQYKIALLTGNMSTKTKQSLLEQLATGDIQLIIGTHALFQHGVDFHKLALVVIDEQHRFGVAQRAALLHKQALQPHQLMLSATPIPRTLALTDSWLKISTIDTLPPKRLPIKTLLIKHSRRAEVICFVKQQASAGIQVFWVCPLVTESDSIELTDVVNTQLELAKHLSPLTVGMIHGQLSAVQKISTMKDFIAQKIMILVATTVIEVGVDVPNANIIIIEHSERLGLAQLHQLRGRVGRGTVQSQCLLLYNEPISNIAQQRLQILRNTNDGFLIAEQDLQLRGPGELLGCKQSGTVKLRFADIYRDYELLPIAKTIAMELIANYQQYIKLINHFWLNQQADSTYC